MNNVRKYGGEPFVVAVIHGGPGAAGEMKPVAEELSKDFGTLEPLQTSDSVDGQVQELKTVLEQYAALPVSLAGYSWGAWLAYILTARYPEFVRKLILVGSGPFAAHYTEGMMATRLSRLNGQEKIEAQYLLKELDEKTADPSVLERFGKLMAKADSFRPISEGDAKVSEGDVYVKVEVQQKIFQNIWPAASELRKNGELLKLGEKINCPVVAIHGDYDPHPAAGVEEPLSKVIKNFRFVLLKNCGHKPWIEQKAKEEFYRILKKELVAKEQNQL